MIISASRRTDIPHRYSAWLFRRLQEGYALVRNPMNFHQVSRVSLRPEIVDGIVFWTKDPTPMLARLSELEPYMYYFQFTLNGYGAEVEPGLPSKSKGAVPAFRRLSERVGPERVIWRYDPIFLSRAYTFQYHIKAFETLAKQLSPYTKKCTISFLDHYRGMEKRMKVLVPQAFDRTRQLELAQALVQIAHAYGLAMDTCAEPLELERLGIGHARCVDGELLGRLLGCPLKAAKDKNQRPACGCAASIDIGAYDTCPNGCLYCYATHGTVGAARAMPRHDPASPLLVGALGPEDLVTERRMFSCRESQLAFGG